MLTKKTIADADKVIMRDSKIQSIGKQLSAEDADAEFIGIAKFTKKGANILRQTFHGIKKDEKFQTKASVEIADFTDMFQELIDRNTQKFVYRN